MDAHLSGSASDPTAHDWSAATIDEVLDRLDVVIASSMKRKSRIGYFAALYRKVTAAVKRGIADGFFDDGERMERLDVVFANRYLQALHQYENGKRPTAAWWVAFDVSPRWWPIVLQHLLLGINAHINLDLGIAAARVAPGERIHGLRDDFYRINEILASLVDEVSDELAEVWPLLAVLDWVGGRSDEELINFSMERAREYAWRNALQLAPLDEDAQRARIDALDQEVLSLADLVLDPGRVLSFVMKFVRLGELRGVARIIDILR